jgi:photosystem II stability/assembly factor-like uncharacterized protein
VRPWFVAIVANECRSVRRTRWWNVMRLGELPPRASLDDRSAERLDFDAALDRLSLQQLLPLTLYYHLDLPIEEVARVLGCSPGAARVRIQRSLAALPWHGDGGRRMTPEERELRSALDARSGEPSSQFRARLSASFSEGRPVSGLMQAVAVVAVVAITLGTVGVLLMSRSARNVSHHELASGSRLASPMATQTIVPPIGMDLPTTAQISAPSRDVVWALIASRALFRSIDQGTTWEQRSMPLLGGGGRPPEFSFVDAQSGWFSTGGVPETQGNGAGAAVWRTTDGAQSWQLVASAPTGPSQRTDSGIAYAQCKEGLFFVDPQHGFLGAWDPNHKPTVYRTADGGKSWSASTLPDPPGFVSGTGGAMLRLRLVKGFRSTLLALADASRPPAYVFSSADGGVTWTDLATWNSGSIYPTFVTASRWLVIGNDSSGQETTDAGKTWHPFATDYADAAGVTSTFVFADGDIGYGTVRGGVQRTVDGGSHWIRIKTPGTPTPFPTSHPPLPPKAANWPSYSSPEYGYSLRYSPRWFDIGAFGTAFQHYFSNNKTAGSPREMGADSVFVVVSADCQLNVGRSTLVSESRVDVDTLPVVRYVIQSSTSGGTFYAAVATIEPGGLCYRISMIGWTQVAVDSYLADFDLMLQTVRFSARTAPVTSTPIPTIPPSN